MNVARPRGGFNVEVADFVNTYIEAEIKENLRIRQFWDDIIFRIRITALREGTRLSCGGTPTFTFIADGASELQIPTIQIVYTCFGDVLTVTAALVWRDSDHEIDDKDGNN